MDAFVVAAAIFTFTVLAALATRNVVALWRGEARHWRWPDRWTRGLPVAVVIGWAFLIGSLMTLIGMRLDGVDADLVALLILVDVSVIVAGVVVWASAFALNRPKFAVPPHLRGP